MRTTRCGRDAVDGKPAGWVDQATTFEVKNDYAVILGQAQVVKSVTTSWNATAAKVGAEWVFTANKVGDSHNYSRSVTTVNYFFNEYGQLRSAMGNTVGDANNEVWRDAVDGKPAGWVDQATTFEVENDYAVILGQAQVVKSVTTSWNATAAKVGAEWVFTANKVGDSHNYSRSVTTVNYFFNEYGQLRSAMGNTVGDANNEVWRDAVDGKPAGWVDQATTFEVKNDYAVILGQAQVVKSVTTSWNATAAKVGAEWVFTANKVGDSHNYSRSVTTVNYFFNEYGQLRSAMGNTVGDANNEVWRDAVDGKPAGWVDQATTFEVKNDYAVILGQAQVVKSVTTSWNATAAKVGAEWVFTANKVGDSHNYSRSVTTVNYFFNEYGQLRSAMGNTVGDANNEVWRDAVDGKPAGWVDQATTFEVKNDYAVILGQAQVVKSVTTSWNATAAKVGAEWVFTANKVGDSHNYSRSVTTVNYFFNEYGQLRSATGNTVGDANNEVWRDAVDGKPAGWVDQATTFEVKNDYAVILGQAQVVKSVTTSWNATAAKVGAEWVFTANKVGDSHNYSRSVTTVNYFFNEYGQLRSATGNTVGDANNEVWRDAVDGKPAGWVDQATTFEVKNDYAVILGQAQVVKSVTTSWNATAAKVGAEWVFTANKVGDSHNYSRSVTTVNYFFNEYGQLRSAMGNTVGDANNEVWRDAVDGKPAGWVDQATTFEVKNDYAVILGQAQVVKSVTTSWNATAAKVGAEWVFTANKVGDSHNYSRSVTTVNYFFNEYGQLRSATGNTVGDANNEVWRDAVDGKPAGWVDQATTFEVKNDYAVILGQAQVVKSVTTSWNATAAKVGAEWVFTANKVGDSHNYSRSVTTVNYFFNEYGQLRSAMGNTVGDANNEVWRDAVDGKPAGWVDQATTFEVKNDYAVILGQAQVVKSVTTSWNATAAKVGAEWVFTANKVGDSHNYSRSVTTVNYFFNEYGQLRSATGNTVATQTTLVKSADLNSDGTIRGDLDKDGRKDVAEGVGLGASATDFDKEDDVDGDGRRDMANEVWTYHDVVQKTVSETVNTYAIILGQALVVRADTTTDVLNDAGAKYAKNQHGYSHTESIVLYQYNEKAQLTGASGTSKSWSSSEVKTPKRIGGDIVGDTNRNDTLDTGETWQYEFVVLPTYSEATNTYGIIRGQAQVVQSVTKIWAGKLENDVISPITQPGLHGYSLTEATVNYFYNENGQLIGADGDTKIWSTNQVKNPKRVNGQIEGDNGNNRLDDGEAWVYEFTPLATMSEVKNTYAVIRGQAVVVKSVTETWGATLNGITFTKIDNRTTHGYSYSKSTVNNVYNDLGQLTDVTGWVEGDNAQATFKSRQDWKGLISSGKTVRINFDATAGKFDDSVFTGDYRTDPMGTLKGGEVYEFTYHSDGTSETEGYDQGEGRVNSFSYSNSVINNSVISLFGRLYTFNDIGEVYDSQYGLVGHLQAMPGESEWAIEGDTNRDGIQQTNETWVTEAQRSTSYTKNTYAVINGQAVVVSSVADTWAADDNGNRLGRNDHGYSHTVSVTQFRYSNKGQLIDARGSTKNDAAQEVFTSGTTATPTNSATWKFSNGTPGLDSGWAFEGNVAGAPLSTDSRNWVKEMQRTQSETVNTYAIILGQAQVVKSVTTTNGVDDNGNIIQRGEHGYSRTVMVMAYSFNALGQLIGATGTTTSSVNSPQVYKSIEVPDGVDAQGNAKTKWIIDGDTNGNGVEETGEVWQTVPQNSSSSVVNTYAIIAGRLWL
jgi:hypothetical protein